MSFQAYDWDPLTIDCRLPLGTQTIIFWTEEKAEFELNIRYDKRAYIDLEIGRNFLCLCNIFKEEILESYINNTFLGTFKSQTPKVITIHKTYHCNHAIILVAQNVHLTLSLECLSKISLLRNGIAATDNLTLKRFPIPIRKLFENNYSHYGEIESLVFTTNPDRTHTYGPINVGRYEWARFKTCSSNCYQLNTIRKPFRLNFDNLSRIRKLSLVSQ
jgi:hypothetical protein